MTNCASYISIVKKPCLDRGVGPYSTPFSHVSEAWFWAMAALSARRAGHRTGSYSSTRRPCEPDDVIKCFDGLYRKGQLGEQHARVLLKWGSRRSTPSDQHPSEITDARLWGEALFKLERILRSKGIVT